MVLDPTLSRNAPPSSGVEGALTTTGPSLSPSPRQVIPKLTLHNTPPSPLSPAHPPQYTPNSPQPWSPFS